MHIMYIIMAKLFLCNCSELEDEYTDIQPGTVLCLLRDCCASLFRFSITVKEEPTSQTFNILVWGKFTVNDWCSFL